jgi:hypothetical protein
MQKYFSGSNPAMPPDLIVLQLTPLDDLCGLGKHGFCFDQLDR